MNGFALMFLGIILPVLANWGATRPQRTAARDVWGVMMFIGFGMAKILLLIYPMIEIQRLCSEARPEAHNGWPAFIGIVSFALLPYLMMSAVSDFQLSGIKFCRGEAGPMIRDPFWTSNAMEFWSRWGPLPRPGLPSWKRVVAGVAIVALLSWRGFSEGLLIWLMLHGLLILLDVLLGRCAGWFRVPKQARAVLGVCLFVLSMPLIYKGSWAAAVEEWKVLFHPPAQTAYSLFLDRRLTSWQVCWVMWGAVLMAVVIPGHAWWMARPKPVRQAVRGLGLFCFFAFVILMVGEHAFPRTGSKIPAGVRSFLSLEREKRVFTGNDGWLYPIQEIDRLTQKRQKPGLAEEVMRMKKVLEDQGAKLLLLPVPDKVTLYPEPVMPAKYGAPVLHPGYVKEVERLRAAGVDVLDLTRLFWERRHLQPFYFKQDSHWTAEAMKEVAVQTSRSIRKTYPQVVKEGTPMVDAQFMERQDIGDLARALTGENSEGQWTAESTQMVGLRGLEETFGSPVLVLGGSLVRVYDDHELSFHPRSVKDAPAAFSTQLGALLGRPVEVTDKARLDFSIPRFQGKKLVVWVVRAGEL